MQKLVQCRLPFLPNNTGTLTKSRVGRESRCWRSEMRLVAECRLRCKDAEVCQEEVLDVQWLGFGGRLGQVDVLEIDRCHAAIWSSKINIPKVKSAPLRPGNVQGTATCRGSIGEIDWGIACPSWSASSPPEDLKHDMVSVHAPYELIRLPPLPVDIQMQVCQRDRECPRGDV